MRRFRSAVVLVVFGAAVFFAAAPPAQACSCMPATYEQHFANADAVFDGITEDKVGNAVASTYRFKVMETFKGSVPDPAYVRTPVDSAACGENFEKDVAYRLFVRKEGNELTTNLCMGNIRSSDAPKITTTTAPKPTTTTMPKPGVTTTTVVEPSTTTSSTTSTTSVDGSVAITTTNDGGGSGWVLPVALGGVVAAAGVGFALYQRSRRTDPAL